MLMGKGAGEFYSELVEKFILNLTGTLKKNHQSLAEYQGNLAITGHEL